MAKAKSQNIMAPILNVRNTMSAEQLKSCGLLGYAGSRNRHPQEATGPQIDKMAGKFVPNRDLVAKIGLAVIS